MTAGGYISLNLSGSLRMRRLSTERALFHVRKFRRVVPCCQNHQLWGPHRTSKLFRSQRQSA